MKECDGEYDTNLNKMGINVRFGDVIPVIRQYEQIVKMQKKKIHLVVKQEKY